MEILKPELKYEKPKFNQIDIDFSTLNLIEIQKSTSIIDSFNYIINKDYEKLNKINKIEKNLIQQTPLMLACYIGDIISVKILLKQVGYVDLNDKSAIDYALNSLNVNDEIIKIIDNFEYNLNKKII